MQVDECLSGAKAQLQSPRPAKILNPADGQIRILLAKRLLVMAEIGNLSVVQVAEKIRPILFVVPKLDFQTVAGSNLGIVDEKPVRPLSFGGEEGLDARGIPVRDGVSVVDVRRNAQAVAWAIF